MAKKYKELSNMIESIADSPADDRDENLDTYRKVMAWNCAKWFEQSFYTAEMEKEKTRPRGLSDIFASFLQPKSSDPETDPVAQAARERVVERYEFNLARLEHGLTSINDLVKECNVLAGPAPATPFAHEHKTLDAWRQDEKARNFKLTP